MLVNQFNILAKTQMEEAYLVEENTSLLLASSRVHLLLSSSSSSSSRTARLPDHETKILYRLLDALYQRHQEE
jgi:hypothetical protein